MVKRVPQPIIHLELEQHEVQRGILVEDGGDERGSWYIVQQSQGQIMAPGWRWSSVSVAPIPFSPRNSASGVKADRGLVN